MKNQTIKTITLSVLASNFLLAAPPSVGNIEKEIVIPKIVKEKKGVNNEIPDFAPKPSQSDKQSAKEDVHVSTKEELHVSTKEMQKPSQQIIKPTIAGFDFVGNDSIKDAVLFKVAKDYVGKDLTPQNIFELQGKLTRFYQSKGFKKARAYAFTQNIKDGIVTFEIRAKNQLALMAREDYIRPNMDEKTFLKDLGYVLQEQPKVEEVPTTVVPQAKKEVSAKKADTLHVSKFEFEGNVHVTKEKLDELLKNYLSKSYSFEELKKITSVVTKHYRDNGYFVARAYIAQGAVDGETLKISIIEGNYGEFKLTNSSLVNDKQIQGILKGASKESIISVDTLERAMLLINDTPGAKVSKADIMPGVHVGTSDFDITTEATNPYSAYVIGDNYGSRYTGVYRANLGLNANSPLGYGDKLSLNGLISTTGDLKNGRVAYGFPLMSNGLRGEVSASNTTYSLAKEYEALDAIGNSTTLEAKLTYPLIRTREETLNLSMGFAHKNMKDEIRSTNTTNKKESDAITIGGDYTQSSLFFGYNSNTNASLYITYGDLSFKDTTSRIQDDLGAKTNGTYSKIAGNLEKSIDFNPEYSLTTSLRFQKALGGKNLDGSEDFSLGGAYGVRAFADGEHSAENGYIFGLELFYFLPSFEGINHKASVFADTGYAKMQNSFANDPSRQLSDIGVGYQASYRDFFTKIQIARVVGSEKVTSESEYNTRALLQLGWIY